MTGFRTLRRKDMADFKRTAAAAAAICVMIMSFAGC